MHSSGIALYATNITAFYHESAEPLEMTSIHHHSLVAVNKAYVTGLMTASRNRLPDTPNLIRSGRVLCYWAEGADLSHQPSHRCIYFEHQPDADFIPRSKVVDEIATWRGFVDSANAFRGVALN